MTLISDGLMGESRNRTLSVPAAGAGRAGKDTADMTSEGLPGFVKIMARFFVVEELFLREEWQEVGAQNRR